MGRTICIYHGNCADGFTAAWAVWKALGEVGKPGGGHSNMVSVAVQLKLFEWDAEGEHWLLVFLGLRIHRKRSYGGIFA